MIYEFFTVNIVGLDETIKKVLRATFQDQSFRLQRSPRGQDVLKLSFETKVEPVSYLRIFWSKKVKCHTSNTITYQLSTGKPNLLIILVENVSFKNRLKSDKDLVTNEEPSVKSNT